MTVFDVFHYLCLIRYLLLSAIHSRAFFFVGPVPRVGILDRNFPLAKKDIFTPILGLAITRGRIFADKMYIIQLLPIDQTAPPPRGGAPPRLAVCGGRIVQ